MNSKYYEIARIKSNKEDQDLEPHRHLYYELFFFFAGSGTHLIDFKDFEINAPSIQLVSPHQLHQVKHSCGSEGYVIKVQPILLASNPNLNHFFNFIQYNQHIEVGVRINEVECNLLKNNCDFLKSYNNDNSEDSLFALLACINLYVSILKKYQQHSATIEENPQSRDFNEFLKLAEKHYLVEKNNDFYAQKMQLSMNSLNNIVKGRTGMSVKKFLIQRTLLEAKRLLIHSDKTVKEIAYELDFLEPAHFTNFFKKYVGENPSNFKADF